MFVGLAVGLGLLIYFLLKKFGYPKTAKYLTIVYGVVMLTMAFFLIFEDQLFTRSQAKELVTEQGFMLTDKFDLIKNESLSGIGDYYHTFTLEISERDKKEAILKIKSADNFKMDSESSNNLLYQERNRYVGPKVIQNYETENSYVREYFKPSGQKGYAPIFRRILISKTRCELTFEDIDE